MQYKVFRYMLPILVVSLMGVVALLGLSSGASADGVSLDVSFTKWVTVYPNMAGTVGGDVGDGDFAGEILKLTNSPDGRFRELDALYHIKGKLYSFTARVDVTQNNDKRVAVVSGVVTEGSLKGSSVFGAYKIVTCSQGAGGNCFQGTLRVTRP